MEPKTVGGKGGVIPSQAYRQASGFSAGAIIMTLDGEKRIEEVRPGDRVITRDTGMAILKEVTQHRMRTRTVRIQAGSLGHTRPERDVTVPAGQPILIRDWRAEAMFGAKRAMVTADRLIDGEFITDLGMQETTLYQIFCDGPHILYCDGLELSTADGARARGAVLHAA